MASRRLGSRVEARSGRWPRDSRRLGALNIDIYCFLVYVEFGSKVNCSEDATCSKIEKKQQQG